jgi:hypothetical protein
MKLAGPGSLRGRAQRWWEKTVQKLITVTLGILALAGGLARADDVVLPLPPADQQLITAKLGSIVGKALPGKPIEDVSVYFPLQERARNYQVTAGPNAGKTQTLGLAKVRRPNGKSAWRFMFSPTLAGFVRQTAEGDLMVPSVTDTGEGVVVTTTPANPFVLKGMKPGETRSYSQQVSVIELDDPADQEYSGSLHGTYTYVGTYQVTVPAGSYEAVLLRLKCEGKVGPAHTHDTAYYFFAPGKGVVAMISQEDATAFWIIHIDTTSGKVLIAN